MGVLVEFGGKISVIYRGGAFDGGFIDIYEELIVERFAAEEDRKVIATTVSQSKADAYALTLDNGGKGNTITDMSVAGGVADTLNFVFIGNEMFTGKKGAFWGKETELKLAIGANRDIARPD